MCVYNIYCLYYLLVNKSLIKVRFVYCLKKESKFTKDISGEETSSKVPINTSRVFLVKTTRKRCYVVSTLFQYRGSVFIGLKQ